MFVIRETGKWRRVFGIGLFVLVALLGLVCHVVRNKYGIPPIEVFRNTVMGF